ncbi:hypothetical protein N5B56_10160 [Eubacterium sp. LFL-14]|uniref:Uncharacterized protein n=1 Tax=Eubacterium album TaxID=2978477 RepID=A0ABT2M5A8_9FIRM|nr:hypothetical protein [Eubacterium sp. LFL-14]MCT7399443.1 hypothetical protein [Eubacterium sp. LFL-14]
MRSQIAKFIKRFLKDPYRKEDKEWIYNLAYENYINVVDKLRKLGKLI